MLDMSRRVTTGNQSPARRVGGIQSTELAIQRRLPQRLQIDARPFSHAQIDCVLWRGNFALANFRSRLETSDERSGCSGCFPSKSKIGSSVNWHIYSRNQSYQNPSLKPIPSTDMISLFGPSQPEPIERKKNSN